MSSLVGTKLDEDDFCDIFNQTVIEKLSPKEKGEYLGKLITFLEFSRGKNPKAVDLKSTVEKACSIAHFILDLSKEKLPADLEKIHKLLTAESFKSYYDSDYPIYSSLKLLQESIEEWKEWEEEETTIATYKDKKEVKECKDAISPPTETPKSTSKLPLVLPSPSTPSRPSTLPSAALSVQKVTAPTTQSISLGQPAPLPEQASRPVLGRIISPSTIGSLSLAAATPITPVTKKVSELHTLSLEGTVSPKSVSLPGARLEMPSPFTHEMLVTRLTTLIDNVFRIYFSNVSLKESPEFGIAFAIRFAQKKLTRMICSRDTQVFTSFYKQVEQGILCALSTLPMLIEVYHQAVNDDKLTKMETPKDRHLHMIYLMAPKIAERQKHIIDKNFIQEIAGSWDNLREKYGLKIAHSLSSVYCEILQKTKLSDSEQSFFETLHLGIAQSTKTILSPQVFISILHRTLFKQMDLPSLRADDMELVSMPDHPKLHPVDQKLDDILTKIFATLMKSCGFNFLSRAIIQHMIASSIATLGSKIQDSWKVTPDCEKQIKTVDRISRLLIINKQEPAFKEYLSMKPEDVKFDKKMQEKMAAEIRKLESPISLDTYVEKLNKQLAELLSCPILLEFFGIVMLRTFADHFAKAKI